MSAAGFPDVDLALVSLEAESEPLLALSAVSPAPSAPGDDLREVVAIPVGSLCEEPDRTDARLLVQFPNCRIQRRFSRIDAALRHLPGIAIRHVFAAGLGFAAADEDEVVFVEQHHADTGAVGQVLPGAGAAVAPSHGTPAVWMALTGTRVMPR